VGLDWAAYVHVDPRYLRPSEVETLVADATKARTELGWEPTIGFPELVERMVVADLQAQGLDLDRARRKVELGGVHPDR
jgi:GDPmannose 4,6-dehydratase